MGPMRVPVTVLSSSLAVLALASAGWKTKAKPKQPARLVPPAPELPDETVKLDLPKVPAFERPTAAANGDYTVSALPRGAVALGTKVSVVGVVIYKYDCAASYALAHPELSAKRVKAEVEKHHDQCYKPYAYLAESASGHLDEAVWLV